MAFFLSFGVLFSNNKHPTLGETPLFSLVAAMLLCGTANTVQPGSFRWLFPVWPRTDPGTESHGHVSNGGFRSCGFPSGDSHARVYRLQRATHFVQPVLLALPSGRLED